MSASHGAGWEAPGQEGEESHHRSSATEQCWKGVSRRHWRAGKACVWVRGCNRLQIFPGRPAHEANAQVSVMVRDLLRGNSSIKKISGGEPVSVSHRVQMGEGLGSCVEMPTEEMGDEERFP